MKRTVAWVCLLASQVAMPISCIAADEDNNVTRPVRITLRRASGSSLAKATCHLTDEFRTYTETPLELNADGSADLELRPRSFAYVEFESQTEK